MNTNILDYMAYVYSTNKDPDKVMNGSHVIDYDDEEDEEDEEYNV